MHIDTGSTLSYGNLVGITWGRETMEKVNVMPVYVLGSAIGRLLMQCFTGSKMMFAIPSLMEARNQLEFFSKYKQAPRLVQTPQKDFWRK